MNNDMKRPSKYQTVGIISCILMILGLIPPWVSVQLEYGKQYYYATWLFRNNLEKLLFPGQIIVSNKNDIGVIWFQSLIFVIAGICLIIVLLIMTIRILQSNFRRRTLLRVLLFVCSLLVFIGTISIEPIYRPQETQIIAYWSGMLIGYYIFLLGIIIIPISEIIAIGLKNKGIFQN
jgi:hypothetical protein